MARRGYKFRDIQSLGKRTTLGPGIKEALDRVNNLRHRMVEHTLSFNYTPREVADWLIPEDTRRLLQATWPVAKFSDSEQKHEWYGFGSTTLNFDFNALRMLAPQTIFSTSQAAPLAQYIEDIRQVNIRFALVRHVLLWLDGNATPAAIRHYWPCVRMLIDLPGEEGMRYAEPDGIAPILPILRETVTTMAESALLPGSFKDSTRPATGLKVCFQKQDMAYGSVAVEIPIAEYNIGK